MDYDTKRRKNFSDKKNYLIEMKRYTLTGNKWKAENEGNRTHLQRVNHYLAKYEDARCLTTVKRKIERFGRRRRDYENRVNLTDMLTNAELNGL